uniref:Uncharacterized protein n=1 Tax=Arundo donax TaxID=35708 RepID=A0A0A9E9N1_ARUDO
MLRHALYTRWVQMDGVWRELRLLLEPLQPLYIRFYIHRKFQSILQFADRCVKVIDFQVSSAWGRK